jgi:hypothetical protein
MSELEVESCGLKVRKELAGRVKLVTLASESSTDNKKPSDGRDFDSSEGLMNIGESFSDIFSQI